MARTSVPCSICDGTDGVAVYAVMGRSIVRCRACGLVYVNSQPEADELDQLYGEQYFAGGREGVDAQEKPVHDYLSFHQQVGEESRYRSEIDELRRYATSGRLLDVGCSTGRFLALAREAGWQTSGVEVSVFASEMARKTWGLDVVTGHLGDARFPPASFDTVTMHHVLEHVPQARTFLTGEVLPILKPGGLLVLEVPNFSSLESRVNGEAWQDLRPVEHLYHFTPETLTRLVQAAGFEVLRVSTKTTGWGVKPALEGLGVPSRWLREVPPPAGWWSDVSPAHQPARVSSFMPALRRLLLAGLSVPGTVVERMNLAKRLVLFGRRPVA